LKKLLYILFLTLCAVGLFAQDDSDENRFGFDYSLTPKEVTIADIKITGASSYEDYVLIGFSGLNKGQ
jgi:outer membrane protein insertion porin family